MKPCGSFILIAELGIFNLCVNLLNLGLKALYLFGTVLFILPTGFHLVEAVLEIGKLLTKL